MSRELRLDTPRLYIRTPKRADFQAWHLARERSRDHLQPWEPLWSEKANTRSDWNTRHRAYRKALRDGRGYTFFLFSKSDDTFLGGIALTNIRYGAVLSASLGYWLSIDATGHGYMTEAVQHVCKWAQTRLKLERIEASTLPENEKSRLVLEQCGFLEEGLARSYLQIAGTRSDHVLYALTTGE